MYLLDEKVPDVVVGIDNASGFDLTAHRADDLILLLL
jgi:hypothetical protein